MVVRSFATLELRLESSNLALLVVKFAQSWFVSHFSWFYGRRVCAKAAKDDFPSQLVSPFFTSLPKWKVDLGEVGENVGPSPSAKHWEGNPPK